MAQSAKQVAALVPSTVAALDRLGNGVPTNYDPHEALKRILMADPLEKALRRKWKKDTKDPFVRQALIKVAQDKVVDQAIYVEWRDGVVVRVRETGGPGRGKKRVPVQEPVLPDFDPGNKVALRWRKLYCLHDVKPAKVDTIKVRMFLEQVVDLLHNAFETVAADNVRGTKNTGKMEWDTPADIFPYVRQVLGTIDLDPASSKRAQKVVKAKRYFTKEVDGLSKPWKGRVWLNPPYTQPLISHFADKMLAEVDVGNVTAAIMLTHNYTSSAWFQNLAGGVSAICFPSERIKFVDHEGDKGAPTQGQAFFYFGEDVARFAEVFWPLGFVVTPVEAVTD